ncbi:MAG: glycoside hydrolase family 32 protein [Chryseosolibacter sp.]
MCRLFYFLRDLLPAPSLIMMPVVFASFYGCRSNEAPSSVADATSFYTEKYRPQLHFSPKENWMNDPNGMVYYKGDYHLFYQYYPDGMVWGPMHWGHAVSTDLIYWKHLPIALYPDSLGLIFSGSAVADEKNTSGFGTANKPPLVAIFTYHSVEKEKAGRTDYENQGIASSIDSGKTWTKYENNPVLKNQGVKDFRDPKVFWHDETGKWVMILAVKDHVELWGSPDLKSWNKLSDFGYTFGAHGGVWECPDLFYSKIEGEDKGKWVMIVSINPGGPNGGSATQYFTGEFDGTSFKPDTEAHTTSWLDYGPDNYAGVTYSNAPDSRNIFIGWMSNWAYAGVVPTSPWRSAMTLPRELSLSRVGNRLYVRSTLSPETSKLVTTSASTGKLVINDSTVIGGGMDFSKAMVAGSIPARDFTIELFNDQDQKLVIGFDEGQNHFFIDRGFAGSNDFSKDFNSRSVAPRVSTNDDIAFTFVSDVSSLEIFFDDGLTVMTTLFFPDEPLTKMSVRSAGPLPVENLEVKELHSIWR